MDVRLVSEIFPATKIRALQMGLKTQNGDFLEKVFNEVDQFFLNKKA
jgi:hypothetical protein